MPPYVLFAFLEFFSSRQIRQAPVFPTTVHCSAVSLQCDLFTEASHRSDFQVVSTLSPSQTRPRRTPLCAQLLCAPVRPNWQDHPPPPSLSRRHGTRFLWCTCPCFCVLTCGPVSLGASPASPGGGATPTAGASGGATDTSCLSLAASRMLHEDGGALTLLLPQGSLPSGLPGDL